MEYRKLDDKTIKDEERERKSMNRYVELLE